MTQRVLLAIKDGVVADAVTDGEAIELTVFDWDDIEGSDDPRIVCRVMMARGVGEETFDRMRAAAEQRAHEIIKDNRKHYGE